MTLIALVTVILCPGVTVLCLACALVLLRSQGLRWSWGRSASPVRYKHIRFLVSNDDVLRAVRALELHGFTLASEARTGWDGGTTVTMKKRVTG